MKLHNVDSQSGSSGLSALDNSAKSTSPVVLSGNYNMLHSSARHYLSVGAESAADIAAPIGHSPSPLGSSGDDQLRVPGLGPLPSSSASSSLSPTSLLFPLTPSLSLNPSSSSSSSSLRHPPPGSSLSDASLSHPSSASSVSSHPSYSSYSFSASTPLPPSPSFTPSSLSSASFPSSSLVTPSLPPSISSLFPYPSFFTVFRFLLFWLISLLSSFLFSSFLCASSSWVSSFLFLCSIVLFFVCSSSLSFGFLFFLFSPSSAPPPPLFLFFFFLCGICFLAIFGSGGPPGAFVRFVL